MPVPSQQREQPRVWSNSSCGVFAAGKRPEGLSQQVMQRDCASSQLSVEPMVVSSLC